MKNYLLYLVVISLFFVSCKKPNVLVNDLEVNVSPVLNLGRIGQDTTVLVGGWAVYNPTQELRTVYSVNIQLINYDQLIDSVSFKPTNSSVWMKVPVQNGIINVVINQSLRSMETTPFIQFKVHTMKFGVLTNPLIVWMKVFTIGTDRGSVIPMAKTDISYAVGG